MASKKCWRVDVLASDVLVLVMALCGLYTDDGTDGGCIEGYMSEDPDEYNDGTCCAEKLLYGTLGGGAPGPVELLFRP